MHLDGSGSDPGPGWPRDHGPWTWAVFSTRSRGVYDGLPIVHGCLVGLGGPFQMTRLLLG